MNDIPCLHIGYFIPSRLVAKETDDNLYEVELFLERSSICLQLATSNHQYSYFPSRLFSFFPQPRTYPTKLLATKDVLERAQIMNTGTNHFVLAQILGLMGFAQSQHDHVAYMEDVALTVRTLWLDIIDHNPQVSETICNRAKLRFGSILNLTKTGRITEVNWSTTFAPITRRTLGNQILNKHRLPFPHSSG